MTQLSPHFKLWEFTKSNTATHFDIDNTIPEYLMVNVERVAYTLEIVRGLLDDRPIILYSGYRSDELNRKVGGSKSSAHLKGLAADFYVPGLTTEQIIEQIRYRVGYDQLINEFDRWVHIGLSEHHRGEVLKATRTGQQRTRYTKI